MSNNQGASADSSSNQAPSPSSNQNTELLQDQQTLGIEALNLNFEQSTTSIGNRPTSAHDENVTDEPHGAAASEAIDEELLVRSPNALRIEARTLIRLTTIIGGNDDGQSFVHRDINARLIAIGERLRQLVSEDDGDLLLMDEEELQREGLRLMVIAQGDEDGRALSNEDADAINRRTNAVTARLSELRPSPPKDEHESPLDIQQMSLVELDDEYDRLVEEFTTKVNEDPQGYHADLVAIQKRHQQVIRRQRDLTHFPSDNSEEILAEADIQGIMQSGSTLPRFLFRGSNSKSGGNESDSELSSSDDGRGSSVSVKSQTVRMINQEDRIVPHAHYADPNLLNHPRRQDFNALLNAADWHTSARRFNTPFTSWTCDFETALYFAIGHYPNESEIAALEKGDLRSDWVFNDADVLAEMITVIDTWTIPDRHLRVFHQPALLLDPEAPVIPTEFLIYGALDHADGVDLRGVSIQELRARARCPTWPHCLSRTQLPHQPSLRDTSEAWTIARAFLQDNWGGEEKEEGAAESIDLGLAVLAGELARQQWASFPPRPDAHVVEAQVQIRWPGAWMRRIRRDLERIAPAPLGTRMSGMPLANAGTPYVGFPQFRLMQQLLLSWVMDYPGDLMRDEGNDDDEEEEGNHDVLALRHRCNNPTLHDRLTELQLATFQSRMVKRDRDGNFSVPPPGEYDPDRSVSPPSTEDSSARDELVGNVTAERKVSEEDTTNQVIVEFVEDSPTHDASAEGEIREDIYTRVEPLAEVLIDRISLEAIEPEVEATVQMRENPGQQQPERGSSSALPQSPQTPRPNSPREPQDQLGLRGGGYEEWEEGVPITFWRVLMMIFVLLSAALYFVLALAVY